MTEPTLFLAIPGRPPTPNTSSRYGNRFEARRVSNQWRQDACRIAQDARNRAGWVMPARAQLHITFVFPTHGKHDWDNLMASTKPLTDGLRDAKVLGDDSTDYLVSVTLGWRYQRGYAATEYTIMAVEADQGGLEL